MSLSVGQVDRSDQPFLCQGDTEPPPPLGDLVDESVPLMTEELMCLGVRRHRESPVAGSDRMSECRTHSSRFQD